MRVLVGLLSIVAFCGSAFAETLTVKESKLTVAATIDKLATVLESKGIKPIARVDHAAGAKAAGLDMPPTQVLLFGNPKVGTPLMLANPHIAIDLPMKVVAWQTADGKVMIGYTAPEVLKARYGIKDKDPLFNAMADALDAFTTAAAAP